MSHIGARWWPVDWRDKTSGATRFVLDHLADADLPPPLWAALHRSPHPLADVLSVDVARAVAAPGVHAVITAADFGEHAYFAGLPFSDRRPLAKDRVRFIGEEIAAVAAETPHAARKAARLVQVRYRVLAAPTTVDEALSRGAATLHERATGTPNVSVRSQGVHGDLDAVLATAHTRATGTFRYPRVAQLPMEPSACIASWDARTERMELWTTTQVPRIVSEVVAEFLDLAPGQVICRETSVGGGFGARSRTCEYEVLAAMLSRKAGRPVVLAYTREEDIATLRSRHAVTTTMTGYASQDGRILGFDTTLTMDNGAYNMTGPFVMAVALHGLGGLYRPVGVRWDSRLVDTATVPGGQMRGLGYPQVALASEVLVDRLAELNDADPLEFRLRNANHAGQRTLGGGTIGSSGLAACLTAVRDAIQWTERRRDRPPYRGLGVAAGIHGSGDNGGRVNANRSSAAIDVFADGRVRLRFGAIDIGTHQATALAQIVAEELGVRPDDVQVALADTADTPFELGQWASRGTYFGGHAVRVAATELAERIRALAEGKLGAQVTLSDGWARSANGDLTIAEVVTASAEFADGRLTHEGTYVDQTIRFDPENPVLDDVSGTYTFAAHAAEVEVDPRTGRVTVLQYVAAHDIGRAINPSAVEGQIIGGAVMGLGAVLGEEIVMAGGRVVNPAYLNYAMPRAADLPDVRPLLIEGETDAGPYGAKSVGELPTCLAAPAVLNAVYDATGIRFDTLPLTADRILEALRARDGRAPRRPGIWRRPRRWQVALVRRAYPLGLEAVLRRLGPKVADRVEPAEVTDVVAPDTADGVLGALGPGTTVLGGGTDLHLQRRQGISRDTRLVSVRLATDLAGVTEQSTGDLRIGAATTLSGLSADPRVPQVVRDAVATIASAQVREVATVGGNLLQAKRCWFYRNGFDCYKRAGAAAPCYAVTGDHRFHHAALGAHRCQATTPSDLGTVLVALDARIEILGRAGRRTIPAERLYRGPGESVVAPDEVLCAVLVPPAARHGTAQFRKLALWSGDFATVSVAVSRLDGSTTKHRVVLGALAPVPWRARATEAALDRGEPDERVVGALDRELTRHGHPLPGNGWKLDAAVGLLEQALAGLATGA
jgi:CO/xanthine dehydrogenase Mo-binding subunit/CO/xanthine dehydrogenase FAD-binding subunit